MMCFALQLYFLQIITPYFVSNSYRYRLSNCIKLREADIKEENNISLFKITMCNIEVAFSWVLQKHFNQNRDT
jgi:hypothetical protein